MNSLAFACVTLVGATVTAFADPSDRAIIAAMKLSEQPNYSWFSMVDNESSSYEIEGRTTSAGITWVKMPMVNSLGRRLSRETETHLEALIFGRTATVVRIQDDWKLLAEIPAFRERDVHANRSRPMVRGSANAGSFGTFGAKSLGAAAPYLEKRRDSDPLANLQFGVTHPHEELGIIVSCFATMEATDEIATGALTDLGAALLLVRAEQAGVEPLTSTGRYTLWFRNGAITKYQLKLEGVVSIGRWKKVNVHVSSVTSLNDIGTTQVQVPDSARAKLQP